MNLQVKILENELWYGGSVADAMKAPFNINTKYFLDMECGLNQTMPFFLSTKGRYIWCEAPMTVTIENGVTTISAGMFEGCKNLETIKIPKSVKNIEFYAFSGCEYLTDIYYEGSKADRDKIIIDSEENAYLLNATWHYNS